MGLFYRDAQGVEYALELEDGPEGTKRPVHGLASSVVATLAATQAAVETLTALITDNELAVIDVDAQTKLDYLVDGLMIFGEGEASGPRMIRLQAAVDAIETKLDSVITGLAAPSAGVWGADNVGMTAAQIDSGTSHVLKVGARIQNVHVGNFLYVGLSNAVSDATGWKLLPGEFLPLPIDNLNKLWLFGSAASTTYRYIAV
jgi:hypothetical protein